MTVTVRWCAGCGADRGLSSFEAVGSSCNRVPVRAKSYLIPFPLHAPVPLSFTNTTGYNKEGYDRYGYDYKGYNKGGLYKFAGATSK